VAVCGLLGLTTEAANRDELEEAIFSATKLLFQDLAREGEAELRDFCQSKGIRYQIEQAREDEMEFESPSLPIGFATHAVSH